MHAVEVVVHVVERNRRDMMFELLGKRIRQARKSADAHPHRQVLALDVTGRNTR
jgi:hypothetical protein